MLYQFEKNMHTDCTLGNSETTVEKVQVTDKLAAKEPFHRERSKLHSCQNQEY